MKFPLVQQFRSTIRHSDIVWLSLAIQVLHALNKLHIKYLEHFAIAKINAFFESDIMMWRYSGKRKTGSHWEMGHKPPEHLAWATSALPLHKLYENQTTTTCLWDSATYIFTDCWACRWGWKCFSAVLEEVAYIIILSENCTDTQYGEKRQLLDMFCYQ